MALPAGKTVEVIVLDELLTAGHWCPHCALPSAVRLPFAAVDPTTCMVITRAATFDCQDCGRQWNEVDD